MSRSRLTLAALFALSLSGAAATAAHAQIGGLLKKARAAIATPVAASPSFDDRVLELDDTRISAVVTGIKASRALTGPNGAAPTQLQAQAGVLFARRDSILSGRDGELGRYQEATAAVANCTRFALDSLNGQHQQAMPALIAKMGGYGGQGVAQITTLSMEMGRKLAAGDTAGALQVREQIWAKLGIDPRADSLAARAKCGSAPAKPAWMTLAEQTLQQANQSLAAARDLEEQRKSAGIAASGLTPQQFAIAHERIAAFVQSRGKPGLPWRFSSAEQAALSARMGELQTLGIE